MALRMLAAALVLSALAPAAAGASARPNFPKTVSGTLSGSSVFKDDSNTVTTNWTVSGARFKLVHVRSAEGSWTGYYSVTAGTVSFKQVETGACGYTIKEKFGLAKSLPKKSVSTALALTRSLTGTDAYDGDLDPTNRYHVMEACSSGYDVELRDHTVNVADLFSTGEKQNRIGRAMKGTYEYVDDAPSGTTTTDYKWSLKPR